MKRRTLCPPSALAVLPLLLLAILTRDGARALSSSLPPSSGLEGSGCPAEPGRCRRGDCGGATPGTLDFWQDPPQYETGSSSPLWTPLTASTASECCDKCRTVPNCTFWQHVSTDPSTPYLMGQCSLLAIALPEGAPGCIPPFQLDRRQSVLGGPCNPEVSDDPHFTDGYGVTFDFSGERLGEVYCLVTDTNFHVNVLLDGYMDTRRAGGSLRGGPPAQAPEMRTWIKEVGFLWRAGGMEHKLHLTARVGPEDLRGSLGYLATATLDGKLISLPLRGDSLDEPSAESIGEKETSISQKRTLTEDFLPAAKAPDSLSKEEAGLVDIPLRYLGVVRRGPYEVERYVLLLPGLARISIQLRPAHALLRTPECAHVHFNLGFLKLEKTAQVHGVIGQTFQSGRERRSRIFSSMKHRDDQFPKATFKSSTSREEDGLLDGIISDYKASSILEANCRRSRFPHRSKAG